jgi:quercetin dioxygenase-like cupin family protein
MAFGLVHSRHDDSPIIIPAIGLELRVRLSSQSAAGVLTMIETMNAPGFGPPLHRHREAEVFRVLTGRYLFEVDGNRFHADAGDVVSVPEGIPHTFVNVTSAPASQLVLIVPGLDAAAFFTQLGQVMRDGLPERDALNSFGQRWGVEFLGSPLKPS